MFHHKHTNLYTESSNWTEKSPLELFTLKHWNSRMTKSQKQLWYCCKKVVAVLKQCLYSPAFVLNWTNSTTKFNRQFNSRMNWRQAKSLNQDLWFEHLLICRLMYAWKMMPLLTLENWMICTLSGRVFVLNSMKQFKSEKWFIFFPLYNSETLAH